MQSEHESRYEIRVKGALDARWSAWFSGFRVASKPGGETALTGAIRDQSALHGALTKVRDLGLPLVAVRCLDHGGNSNMPDEQVREFVRCWAEAECHGDPRALDDLMSDDCTLIGPRGFVLNRQQCLDRYLSGALRTEAFDWSDVTIRRYGPTAVVLGIVAQRAAYQGQDASGRFRATQFVVQRDGDWKCAGLQFSGPIPGQ